MEYDCEIKPLHYTKLSVAIVESLNPKHHVTFYVKDGYKYTLVNGRMIYINTTETKYPMKHKYEE